MLRILIALCALTLLTTACPNNAPQGEGKETAIPPPTASKQVEAKALESATTNPIARGQEIFTSEEYSNTGLTCAMCHAMAPSMDEGKIYIASAAYIAARRKMPMMSKGEGNEGASQEEGNTASLVDSTNKCITSPYMNHPDGLSEDDAAAIVAFLESIYTEEGTQQPFEAREHYDMPAAGFTPDIENGKLVYLTSCKFCHDNGFEGMPSLVGASEWLTPIQVMAKVRKVQGDWFNDFDGQTYAYADPLARQLAWLGINTAYAQGEAMPPHGEGPVPPHGEGSMPPPRGEGPKPPHGEGAEGMDPGAQHGEQGGYRQHMIFPENAMPGYAPEILSDQYVVDVSFYVAEKL